MKMIWVAIVSALVVGLPGCAAAADIDLPVPIQQYNQIRYYSGGVSVDERRQLPQLYPLKMIFSTDQGHMLCDVTVNIVADGKAFFHGSAENGPWMIVDLPPGVYDIEAILEGKARSAKGIRIAAGKKQIISFKWKTSEVNMGR